MIKIKKKIFIIFFFISLISNAFAENKIVFLDLDLILSNTNVGKNVFEKLKTNESKKNEEFNAKEKTLKDEEDKILASRGIINDEQLQININEFQKKIKRYKNLKSEEITKLKKVRNDEIINLLNLINPLIEEYMSNNSIDIIVDKKNIYIANKKYDITNNLIELINKKLK